jgi:hypothetical protein
VGDGVFAEEEVGSPEFAAGAAEFLDMIHGIDDGRKSRASKAEKRAKAERKGLIQVRIIS